MEHQTLWVNYAGKPKYVDIVLVLSILRELPQDKTIRECYEHLAKKSLDEIRNLVVR